MRRLTKCALHPHIDVVLRSVTETTFVSVCLPVMHMSRAQTVAASKANRVLGMVRRQFNDLDKKSFLINYKGFIRPPPPKQQSRRLSAVVWTTATPFCTACQTAFCGSFSPFRTPLHVWSQELDDVTTSRRCCVSCIGCLFVSESSTRLHAWYTSRWLVRHPHT